MPYEESHKMINNVLYKLCSDCGKWLPMNEEYYHKNKSSKDGFFPYCKEDARTRSLQKYHENGIEYNEKRKLRYKKNRKQELNQQKEYRKNNWDKKLESIRKWQINHPDKVRGYNDNRGLHKTHEISNYEWEECKNYFNYRCAYCNIAIEDHWFMYAGKMINGDFAREHVNPNGANDLSNCIPSCKSCNCQKWEYEFEDWYSEGNLVYSEKRKNKIIKWLESDYKFFKQ